MLANWKQNLEISAREKLNIPQTERCIFIAEARYMDQQNETGAESGDDLKSKITNSLIKIRPSKSKLAKFEQVTQDAQQSAPSQHGSFTTCPLTTCYTSLES